MQMTLFMFIGMSLLSLLLIAIGMTMFSKYKKLIEEPHTSLEGKIIRIESHLRQSGYGVAQFKFAVCNFEFNERIYEIETKEAAFRPHSLEVEKRVKLRLYNNDPESIVIDDADIYGFVKQGGFNCMIVALALFLVNIAFTAFML